MKFKKDEIEDSWRKQFIKINNRKPKHMEELSWRVGFNMGCEWTEGDEDEI